MSKQARILTRGRGVPTQDGDGVKLTRVMGTHQFRGLDPFLMLDEFGSSDPVDYQGGFPPHPHRGFQTVTYMLQGRMEHTDHLGNVGLLKDGGLQWMNAGRGIIHSEMPKQTEGVMWGFQLWVNLPSAQKMSPAWYKDIPVENIPVLTQSGVTIKVLAGQHQNINGAIFEEGCPTYLDIEFMDDSVYEFDIQPQANSLLYVFVGDVNIGNTQVSRGDIVSVGEGDVLCLTASKGARCIYISGQPIGEPVVQYGPFVMNTAAEIDQAIRDYQAGTLAEVAEAK